MTEKLTAADIEIALAWFWFDPRRYLMVPNVSWGMFRHELDLCVLSSSGYLTEVEIKVTKADIKRDANKHLPHYDARNRIKYLWFAIPDYLYSEEVAELMPVDAGILTITKPGKRFKLYEVKKVRAATARPGVQKLSDKDKYQLARLGTMRVWSLRLKMVREKERLKLP